MLNISEHFYSIQGEGASVGVPAYFIRLKGCNLMCGGKDGKLKDSGDASWWCDSERLWRDGREYSNEEFVNILSDGGYLDNILKGITHLVWTGGEPTMVDNRRGIIDFINHINTVFPYNDMFNEIETNGTIFSEDMENFYLLFIDQINCSPKLSNSGMRKYIRINTKSIYSIMEHREYYFKFVINSEEDILEAQNDYIIPFKIPLENIIIMPGVDNRDDLPDKTRFIFEMTKKYGYRSITRQHILAWDRVCGV